MTGLRAGRGYITDADRNELIVLLKESVEMTEKGFAVDLERRAERWDTLLKSIGLHRGYRLMAERLSDTYTEAYGRPYLFTEKCMAYEIEYHADAYFWANGYRGYRRNVTSWLFGREELISHCRTVDISTDDIASTRQRLMFGYRRGVRPEYRNTPADPFDRSPWPVRLLRRIRGGRGKEENDA